MPKRLTHDEAVPAMLAVDLRPLEPYPGNTIPWLCECLTCGQELRKSRNAVQNHGHGCVPCMPRKSRTTPEIDAEFRAAGYEPLEEYWTVNQRRLCRCLVCGAERHPTLHAIRDGHRCFICAARERAYKDPNVFEQQMRDAGLRPIGPYPGFYEPWPFYCVNGHLVAHIPHARATRGTWACSTCLNIEAVERVARLTAQVATFGWTVIEKGVQGASSKWLLRHRCGHEARLNPYSVGRYGNGEGCRRCSVGGFNPALPAHVYLISLPDKGLLKVGITGDITTRLASHRRTHGTLVEIHISEVMPGTAAQRLENFVLSAWDGSIVEGKEYVIDTDAQRAIALDLLEESVELAA